MLGRILGAMLTLNTEVAEGNRPLAAHQHHGNKGQYPPLPIP